jgi:hypothetical protein
MTLVSIITPSYNQADFLEDAIQSVLRQDYAPLEYIIVDGGSTDGSQEIIERYSDRLAWWVSEPDRGQAEAINKGFLHADGEIIAWLNSDDLYLPGAVRQGVAALQADPTPGLVFGDALTIDAQGRPLNRLSFGDWGLIDLMSFRIICQPAVFMRRSVLEEAGLLDSGYHFMLDHQLWIKMARRAPVKHIPSILAAARHHPQAKNIRQSTGFSQETQSLLGWMANQPDLAADYSRYRRRIQGGAYRLQARYYLDGDQPAEALRYYGRALLASPRYALRHVHRMFFALLELVGLKGITQARLRQASARQKLKNVQTGDWTLLNPAELNNWPGIHLTGDR